MNIEIILHNLNIFLIYTHNSFLKSMKKVLPHTVNNAFSLFNMLNGLFHLVPLLLDQELYINDEVIKRSGIFSPQGEYS